MTPWKIMASVVAVSAFLGVAFKADLRWVKNDVYALDVKDIRHRIELVEHRIQQQIELDKAQKLQERIWDLQKYYRGRPMPEPVIREIELHEQEIQRIYRETGTSPGG